MENTGSKWEVAIFYFKLQWKSISVKRVFSMMKANRKKPIQMPTDVPRSGFLLPEASISFFAVTLVDLVKH